uniref:Uncharacterized protein n=1 Tax=uncultured marine virus TaxID=186617 RepID=A0A0F7L8P9_9VIRU|nr:hypothetical protein [uncultured marine virus]
MTPRLTVEGLRSRDSNSIYAVKNIGNENRTNAHKMYGKASALTFTEPIVRSLPEACH